MADLFRVVFLVAAAGALVGLVLLAFKSRRRLGARLLVGGLICAVAAAIGGTSADNADAQRLGFASGIDRTRAEKLGITDPQVWKIKAAELDAAAQARVKAEEAFFRIPEDQKAFEAATAAAAAAYRAAPNDLAKGGVRSQRRADTCRSLRSRAVVGWIGRITELGSNSDGKGVLSIAIGGDVVIKTWNNALSDVMHETLIDPASRMFATLAALKKGQRVKFSGQFFESDVDCVFESSMTLNGSMTSPEFIMRFRSIETP